MWYRHETEHYSSLKRKEILTHATMWMNLEDAVLNKISSVQSRSHVQLSVTPWTPGLPVHHQLPELTQTHVHQASDAI